EKADALRSSVAGLSASLRPRMTSFGLTPDATPRMTTLRSASTLVAALTAERDPHLVIAQLAAADLQTSEAALAQALARASDLQTCLAGVQWDALESVGRLHDHRTAAAAALIRNVK